MNWAEEVKTLAFEFDRFVPNSEALRLSLLTPIDASYVV
jgi:hypothetical protein